MMKPFKIRNLRQESSFVGGDQLGNADGVVQVSGPEYDNVISNHPSASLMYTDDDDGEIITIGSSLELDQRLEEPLNIPLRRPPQLRRSSQHPPAELCTMHLFDIRRTKSAVELWKAFHTTGKGLSATLEKRDTSSISDMPAKSTSSDNHVESDLIVHVDSSDDASRRRELAEERQKWFWACNPPRMIPIGPDVGINTGQQYKDFSKSSEGNQHSLSPEPIPLPKLESTTAKERTSLTPEARRQAQEAAANFGYWRKPMHQNGIESPALTPKNHENRWASYNQDASFITAKVNAQKVADPNLPSALPSNEDKPLLEAFEAEMAKMLASTTENGFSTTDVLHTRPESTEASKMVDVAQDISAARRDPFAAVNPGEVLVNTIRSLAEGVGFLGEELKSAFPQIEQGISTVQRDFPGHANRVLRGALEGLGTQMATLAENMQNASQATRLAADRSREADLHAVEIVAENIRGFVSGIGDVAKIVASTFDAELGSNTSRGNLDRPVAREGQSVSKNQFFHNDNEISSNKISKTSGKAMKLEEGFGTGPTPLATAPPMEEVIPNTVDVVSGEAHNGVEQERQCVGGCAIERTHRPRFCQTSDLPYPSRGLRRDGLHRKTFTTPTSSLQHEYSEHQETSEIGGVAPAEDVRLNRIRCERSRSPPSRRRRHVVGRRYGPPALIYRNQGGILTETVENPPRIDRLLYNAEVVTSAAAFPGSTDHLSLKVTTGQKEVRQGFLDQQSSSLPNSLTSPGRESGYPAIPHRRSWYSGSNNEQGSTTDQEKPMIGFVALPQATETTNPDKGDILLPRRVQSLAGLRGSAQHGLLSHDEVTSAHTHKDVQGGERHSAAQRSNGATAILDEEVAEPSLAVRYPSLVATRDLRRATTTGTSYAIAHAPPEIAGRDSGKPLSTDPSSHRWGTRPSSPDPELTKFPTLAQFESQSHTGQPRTGSNVSKSRLAQAQSLATRKDSVETRTKLPSMRPTQVTDQPVAESSGQFFNRMTGLEPHNPAGSKSDLLRANTITSSNPAARLQGPFDPLNQTLTASHKDENLKRNNTERISSRRFEGNRRPYSEHFSGNGRMGWESFLKLYERTPGSFPAEDDNRIGRRKTAPPPLDLKTIRATQPRIGVQGRGNKPILRIDTSAHSARPKTKIEQCVRVLGELGFGSKEDGGEDRLAVYAGAADGDIENAIEMIEEERRAYRERGQ